jgi:hypothetical protein
MSRGVAARTTAEVSLVITDSGSNASGGLVFPEPLNTPARPVRPRWAVVVIAAVVVLAASIGVVLGSFLIGPRGGAAAAAAGYVPANATMYYEMRLDLPGDQRAMLEQFLGHFSGVDLDTVLGEGLDTALDQAFSTSGSGYTYTKDLKPWLTGQLAVALVGYPSMVAGSTASMPTALLFVGARDSAAATQLLGRIRSDAAKAGSQAISEQYAGATIWNWTTLSGTTFGPQLAISATVTTDQLIVGVGKDVLHTALDVHAGKAESLADRSEFRDGIARLPVDRVATYAIDSKAIADTVSRDLASASPGLAAAFNAFTDTGASFGVGSARFEGSRIVADAATTYASGTQARGAPVGLTSHLPGDALVYAASADVGPMLTKFADAVKAAVAGTPNADQLQQFESALGTDLKSFVSWIGDVAFVASWDGHEPSMGLVITTSDAHQASLRLLQLQGLLQLSPLNGGPKATISEAQHGSARITTIKFDTGAGAPAWATTVQYTVTDDRVVIGLGEKFVASVLDTKDASSLAGQQRFRDAASAAGGSTDEAAFWLDLAAVREAIVAAVPPDALAEYHSKAEMWVKPFDYAISVSHASGSSLTNRMVIAVK